MEEVNTQSPPAHCEALQPPPLEGERSPERQEISPYHSPRHTLPPIGNTIGSGSGLPPVGPSEEEPMISPTDPSEFVPPSQLVQPLKCPNCHDTFATKFLLNSHPCGSSNGTSHKCGLCSKTFTRRYNLKIHVQKHFGQFPHKCGICGTGFTKRDALRKHQMKHQVKFVTKQRPQCDICHQYFTRKYTMRLHRAKHMEDGQWKCPFCTSRFEDIMKLRIHVQSHGILSKGRDRNGNVEKMDDENDISQVIPRNLIFSDAGEQQNDDNSVISQSDSEENDVYESRPSDVTVSQDEHNISMSPPTQELMGSEYQNNNPPLDFSRTANQKPYPHESTHVRQLDQNENIPEQSNLSPNDPKYITIYKQESLEIDGDLMNHVPSPEKDNRNFRFRPDSSRNHHRVSPPRSGIEGCPTTSSGMIRNPSEFPHQPPPAGQIRHISPSIIPRRYHAPGMMGMSMPPMIQPFPMVVANSPHSLSPVNSHPRRRTYGDPSLFSPPASFPHQRHVMNLSASQDNERMQRNPNHSQANHSRHPNPSMQNDPSSSGNSIPISPNGGRPESAISNMSAHSSGEVGRSSWRCSNCRISFEDSLMYVVHMGCHSHDNPYACNMCGHVCTDRLDFMLHFVKGQHS